MPQTIELSGRREVTNESETRVYYIRFFEADTEDKDPNGAAAYFLLSAPTISGLELNDVKAREVATKGDGSSVSSGIFEVTAEYGLPPLSTPVNTVRTSSRTALTSVRVVRSKENISATAASWFTAEDYEGLINVDENGDAEGVDVQIPTTVYTVTKKVLSSTVTDTYETDAHNIVGKTNSAIYRTRAIGTLLCSGVSIGAVDDQHSEVAAEFLYAENETSISVGSITVPSKKAWEYLWVRIAKRKVSNRTISQIAQANVERLYDSADFATALGF